MNNAIFTNYYEVAAVILFGIGLTTLLLHKNLIKKIMGFNIMDTAIYLFLTSKGYIMSHLAPILVGADIPDPSGNAVRLCQRHSTDARHHRPPLQTIRHAGYRPDRPECQERGDLA